MRFDEFVNGAKQPEKPHEFTDMERAIMEGGGSLDDVGSKTNVNSALRQVVAEGSGAPTLKKPFHKKVIVDNIELIARSSGNNDLNITAFLASEPGDTPIAQAKFWKEGSHLFSEKTFVSQNYQRKGIATLMYQFVKSLGFNIQPSKEKTELGQALWKGFASKDSLSKKSIAQKFNQGVVENFADGKVKGRSRPGRVKAAGASCSGSVTDLRAKAKKSGGEKGKMYHWCANMKAGRK